MKAITNFEEKFFKSLRKRFRIKIEGENMNNDKFKTCYKELKIEGILRSILLGLTIGLSVSFVVFLFGIIISTNLLLVGLVISGIITLSLSPFLYHLLFKPTNKKVAERIDVFGMEERTITMIELEGNDSFIAKAQRKNTEHKLSEFTPKLLNLHLFVKPVLTFSMVFILMLVSLSFMIVRVNAAQNGVEDPPINGISPDDENFQEMIDNLLRIISDANIDINLKNTLYGMVVDLEERLPNHNTYLEKYADVLQTRNEILQLINEAIQEIEEMMLNIAQALQKYENTEILGLALATWDDDIIIAAFEYMYERIEVLADQELYDVMWQTALDIEAALEEAVGTYPPMHQALQDLADAYKIALESYSPGNEDQVLAELQDLMQESLESLLESIQELRDMIEELLDLEDELEDAIDEVDEFPIFMPFPEDDQGNTPPVDPTGTTLNTVIDGTTPYEDVFDEFFTEAMNWLMNENISEDLRRIIENYFRMLD
jgi:hypothetical protein